MTARDADLSIEVDINEAGTRLTFSDTQVGGLTFRGQRYRGTRDQRTTLNDALRDIVADIGADATRSDGWGWRTAQRIGAIRRHFERQHWTNVTRAVERLYERGQALTDDLFGDESDDVKNIFRRACPLWITPDPSGIERLPLIQVKGHLADAVPIEYLPLLDPAATPPHRIENVAQLTDALRPFIGFSALVKRTVDDTAQSQVEELPNIPTLPIKFFRNTTLNYTGKELANLESKRWVAVDTWRDASALRRPDFRCHVAGHIWIHNGERFDGSSFGSPFQILHFACHCNTQGVSDNHRLIFGQEGDTDTQVTIGQLKQCRQQQYRKQIEPFKDAAHPLVFMNACDSSVMDPTAVTSFPHFFLSRGSCAYIGTEAPVPDELAELFSDAFYTEFLQGTSIGTALHRAKWHLLQVYDNPLGLLYMLYGNPDITLEKPWAFTPASV